MQHHARLLQEPVAGELLLKPLREPDRALGGVCFIGRLLSIAFSTILGDDTTCLGPTNSRCKWRLISTLALRGTKTRLDNLDSPNHSSMWVSGLHLPIHHRIYDGGKLTRCLPDMARNWTLTRDLIFVSYSHRDKKRLEELLTVLKPDQRQGTLKIWADPYIKAGDDWYRKIGDAMDHACLAVLLASHDYFASSVDA